MRKNIKIDTSAIAGLSRLKLTDREKKQYDSQLKAIFAHFKSLNSLDLTKVVSSGQITGLTQIYREDIAIGKQSLNFIQALGNAPVKLKNQFKVKAILGKNGQE